MPTDEPHPHSLDHARRPIDAAQVILALKNGPIGAFVRS